MKRYFWLLLVILCLLFLPGCAAYEKLIDTQFNSFGQTGYKTRLTAYDLPEEGWQEVEFPDCAGRDPVEGFFKAAEHPAFNVLYIHGADWAGKYSYLLNELDLKAYADRKGRRDFNILAVELSGWKPEKNGFRSIQDYIDDALGGAKYLKERFPDRPLVVCGDSLGAHVALLAAASDREGLIDGVISISPFTSFIDIVRYTSNYGRKAFPWFMRACVKDADRRMKGFFSRYDLRTLAGQIKAPVLILAGKGDTQTPPWMAMEIYDRIKAPKALYLMEYSAHCQYHLNYSRAMDEIFDRFFAHILEKSAFPAPEVGLIAQVVKEEKDYRVTVALKDEDGGEGGPVDLYFFQKDRVPSSYKVLFTPTVRAVTLELPFKPERIYGFRPAAWETAEGGWEYRMTPEEKAFTSLLVARNKVLFSGAKGKALEEARAAALAGGGEAAEVLRRSDRLYYPEWLADEYFGALGAFRESMEVYEELLKREGLPEGKRVEYLFRLYRLAKKRLQDPERAASYYQRLLEYDHRKYYVALAIEMEREGK